MNVALIIFNRPRLTARVLEQIAQAQPDTLFVIGDGPRPHVPEDVSLVRETRAMIDRVNWPCRVITNYSDVNMGCGIRPFTGITWVFEQVDKCIILEDDCLPDPTFFTFCEQLLVRYADDPNVIHISGDNFLRKGWSGPGSYYGSVYPFIWGWATWRRSWRYMDFEMREWPALKKSTWLADCLRDASAVRYWSARFDFAAGGTRRDIWDIAWVFACWRAGGVAIHPHVNLVKNIGWGAESTHTKEPAEALQIEASQIRFPLEHPSDIPVQWAVDKLLFERIFVPRPRLLDRLKNRHTYGAIIRSIPGVGQAWAKWRNRRFKNVQAGS